jgi:hypothetical protein
MLTNNFISSALRALYRLETQDPLAGSSGVIQLRVTLQVDCSLDVKVTWVLPVPISMVYIALVLTYKTASFIELGLPDIWIICCDLMQLNIVKHQFLRPEIWL